VKVLSVILPKKNSDKGPPGGIKGRTIRDGTGREIMTAHILGLFMWRASKRSKAGHIEIGQSQREKTSKFEGEGS